MPPLWQYLRDVEKRSATKPDEPIAAPKRERIAELQTFSPAN